MAKTMSKDEAQELTENINKLINNKYEATVTKNWAGGHFVGIGLKSPK